MLLICITLGILTKLPANYPCTTVAPARSIDEVPCVVVFHLYYSLHSIVLIAAVAIQSNTWRVLTSMGSVCSEKKPLSGMH